MSHTADDTTTMQPPDTHAPRSAGPTLLPTLPGDGPSSVEPVAPVGSGPTHSPLGIPRRPAEPAAQTPVTLAAPTPGTVLTAPGQPTDDTFVPSGSSTTTATPSASTLSLDGELPRLAAAMPPAPAPSEPTPVGAATSPVSQLAIRTDEGPPEADDAVDAVTSDPATPAHPMAHLMPEKAAPSEASLQAAQLRAAKKKKARRVKIIVAVAALAIAALAGPPLVGWLTNAINESGSTEQPTD